MKTLRWTQTMTQSMVCKHTHSHTHTIVHLLTMKKKWLICESSWLTDWLAGSKDKEIEKRWKRRNENDDCGGRVMMITADNECVYHKLFICLASSLCSIVRESFAAKLTCTMAVAAVEKVAIEQINES